MSTESPYITAVLSVLVLVVAMLYSSVGHGGASGYLAVMSFFAFTPAQMSSTALVLNILVAGIACATYVRAGYLSGKLTWPFVVASVPAAYVGGLMQVSVRAYQIMLALVLVFAAARLGLVFPERENPDVRKDMHVGLALVVGAVLGAISGIIGVGGGIFLSPLMILMNWAGTKQTAATSACFIVVNSAAGLLGRATRQGIEVGSLLPLVAAAAIGGFAGSYLGAKRLSGLNLRRLLAIVLVIAAVKLILTAPH
ncbi:MAG TPA: sulfite exporter TauE/SafE family protein [Candidatus Obscuribacterales bacterium]